MRDELQRERDRYYDALTQIALIHNAGADQSREVARAALEDRAYDEYRGGPRR